MTYPQIDARGRSCPEPVILTKRAVNESPEGVQVLIDNATARDNISRFGKNAGYQIRVEQQNEDFLLTLSR